MESKVVIKINWIVNQWVSLPNWSFSEKQFMLSESIKSDSIKKRWIAFQAVVIVLSVLTSMSLVYATTYKSGFKFFSFSVFFLLFTYFFGCKYWNMLSIKMLPRFNSAYQNYSFWNQCKNLPYNGRVEGVLITILRFYRKITEKNKKITYF
jgi:hypothetical protein